MMKILRKYLSWTAGAALSLMFSPVHATIITVDPGALDGPSNSPILFGAPVTQADPVLDILFADMKHIEVTSFLARLSSLANLTVDPLPVFAFLTDEVGAEIPNTRSTATIAVVPGSGGTVGVGRSVIPAVISHGIHIELPNLTQDLFFDVRVDGQVGKWRDVPEPATLALFGLGLAGLSFARRRKLHS